MKKKIRKKSVKRSGLEDRVLEALNKITKDYKYEGLKVAFTIDANYIPDIVLPNGILVEVKGYFRKEDQVKMRAVKKSHPELDIRFVFGKLTSTLEGAQKRKDGSKMTCEEYAIKYEFPYAEGSVPEEWLNER